MSLLTEEQTKDLAYKIYEYEDGCPIGEFSNATLEELIREWNEKQTGVQFYVNWNNAPISATRAELQIAWYNSDRFLISENILGFIPRPTTPHPHAEIIAKYAEVAARRCDPWVEFEFYDEQDDIWCKGKNDYIIALNKVRHIGDKAND